MLVTSSHNRLSYKGSIQSPKSVTSSLIDTSDPGKKGARGQAISGYDPKNILYIQLPNQDLDQLALGMLRSLNKGLSTPTPIAFRPLSTYMTAPVIAEASGDARKAAVFPTSSVEYFSKVDLL